MSPLTQLYKLCSLSLCVNQLNFPVVKSHQLVSLNAHWQPIIVKWNKQKSIPWVCSPLRQLSTMYNFASISDPSIIPKLHQLDLLKGKGKSVKLIDTVAYDWTRVALRLHFERHHINRIDQDCHQQSIRACRTMFNDWLEGTGRKPTSWITLIEVLKEAEMLKVATDLECILGNIHK